MKRSRFISRSLLLTAIAWLVVHGFVGEVVRIRSHSMNPTLHDGQRVWVNRLAYGLRWVGNDDWWFCWDSPQRGDIVIFTSPHDGQRLVKRIMAVAGDRVGAETVPANSYYLVGDHRLASHDSRHFGFVPRSAIIGQVVGID